MAFAARSVLLVFAFLVGCQTIPFDVGFFQPPITVSHAPARPITQYSLYNNTTLVKLEPCPMRCEPEGDAYFHPKMSLRADFSR